MYHSTKTSEVIISIYTETIHALFMKNPRYKGASYEFYKLEGNKSAELDELDQILVFDIMCRGVVDESGQQVEFKGNLTKAEMAVYHYPFSFDLREKNKELK